MADWTKKQIRELCGHLDTAWLLYRPLTNYAGETKNAEAYFRNLLALRRTDLVLAGVRNAIARAAERYLSDCECIGNAIVRGVYGAGTGEHVEKLVADAKAEDAARAKQEALLKRLLSEELPLEVRMYDPILKK